MDQMHLKIIVKTVSSYCNNSVERDELMSDCYLAYCQKFLPNKDKAENEYAFLKTIMVTTCLDYCKKKNVYEKVFTLYYPGMFELDDRMTYEMQLEDQICLKMFLEGLSDRDLSFLKLLYEQVDYKTIAEIRGLSLSGIKCGVNKFRKRLQRKVILTALKK